MLKCQIQEGLHDSDSTVKFSAFRWRWWHCSGQWV